MTIDLPELVQAYLQRVLIENARPLVVSCDAQWAVRSVSGDANWYGFADDGAEAAGFASQLFMGLDLTDVHCLPFVEMATRAAHIHCLPDGEWHHVVFVDAQLETERQREVQQAGHQAELDSVEKQRALQRLRAARNVLEAQRKQLEEANAIKGAFISTLSHEFRTPLTSIFGYLHLLERRNDLDNDALANVRAIHRAALHLFGLAENLLEFGRGESGTIQLNPIAIRLPELAQDLQSLFRPLAEAQHLDFRTSVNAVAGGAAPMFDEVKLKQVLINLVSNAIRYTTQGQVRVELDWNGKELKAAVIDTGIGIPADKLDTVFTPFNRGGHQGSKGAGLGLSIVKRLVEAMQGRIELESEVGRGTTFRVHLPQLARGAVAVEAGATEHSGIAPIAWREGLSAVIADDDPDIRDLLKLLLEDLGYRTVPASNAQEAFDAALSEQPDLVLIDVQMPGASGNTAVYRLRSHGHRGRIVTLSADASNEAREASLSAGADHYLTKPIQLELFSRLLKPVRG